MAMAGIREVLVYAENEKKVVTVTAGTVVVTGKVVRVNPLIIEQTEGKGVMVVDFDAIQAVHLAEAACEEVINACKPQPEARFLGTRKM